MSRLAKLKSSIAGHTVYVNPASVRYIDSYQPGITVIHFDLQHMISVNEPVDVVQKALEETAGAASPGAAPVRST